MVGEKSRKHRGGWTGVNLPGFGRGCVFAKAGLGREHDAALRLEPNAGGPPRHEGMSRSGDDLDHRGSSEGLHC
jgi:hypothetical protein